MDSELFAVRTGTPTVTDVEAAVERCCAGRGDRLCHVFVPHATAGVAPIETGSGSGADLDAIFERVLPRTRPTAIVTARPGTVATICFPCS